MIGFRGQHIDYELTNCIVLCMTHLFLRDNESESAPKVSECESLNSEARMGRDLLEKCS